MPDNASKWVCCQLGAREHYAVPRALQQRGALGTLVTEAWVRPGHWLGRARRSLRERFQAELSGADVRAFNVRSVAFELRAKLMKQNGWPLLIARNRWFQRQVIGALEATMRDVRFSDRNAPPTLFAYSYAALEIFRWAKAQGWRTVLGQIDPGLAEERLVARLHSANPASAREWKPAPTAYWADWRAECDLADRIVVNSGWARSALVGEGIAAGKIRLVPLAYSAPAGAAGFQRVMADKFTAERPLRVLFLGQINLRKGVGPLLEAMRLVRGAPVEFWLVGPEQIPVPEDLRHDPQVRWFGPVARGATAEFYQQADVFLFPTFSDGFGLTQLEAQAWRLPVIASRNCGEVVRAGSNGMLLPEITPAAIADNLKKLVEAPARLGQMSRNSQVADRYSLASVGRCLQEDLFHGE